MTKERAEYMKKWRKEHKEQVKKTTKIWRTANKQRYYKLKRLNHKGMMLS